MRFQEIKLPVPVVDGLWGAKIGNHQFIIAYIKELGYTASFKNSNYIDEPMTSVVDFDKPYKTFDEAEAACDRTWESIRRPN